MQGRTPNCKENRWSRQALSDILISTKQNNLKEKGISDMKKIIKALAISAGILVGTIAVQMALCELFTWQAGETFSKLALGIAFYYAVFCSHNERKMEKQCSH